MYFNSSTLAYVALFIALIGVVIIIPSYLKAKSEQSTRPGQRWLLLAIRILCIAVIVFLIFDPRATTQDESKESKEVAILVDMSQSMDFKDADGKTRWDKVAEETEKLMETFSENHHPKLYTFGDELLRQEDLPDTPTSHSSDLGSALMELTRSSRTTPLGAVVVLSDGQVSDNESVRDSAWELKKRGVAVHGVTIGDEEEHPDISLRSIDLTQPLPFERKVSLLAEVGSSGFKDREVLLSVKEKERVIHEQTITLNGEQNQTLNLSFLADQQGYQILDISIQALDGERLTSNNVLSQGLEIKDEKIRVLYIEGSHKTLATLPTELSKDPAIEVTTLFVDQSGRRLGRDNYKKTPTITDFKTGLKVYNVTHPEHGMPLDKEELFKYDVIINSDIYKEAFTKEQLDAMVEFVENKGGGFVMIGGHTAFGSGDYDETVIDRILPVEINFSNDTVENIFHPEITELGKLHPILQVGATKKETEMALLSIPRFKGINIVDRAKPGAITLGVQTRFLVNRNSKNKQPPTKGSVLWAVQQIGKGRSMAFTSDTTPDWGSDFESSWGISSDPRKYYRAFWNNSVRWLASNRLAIKSSEWSVKTPEPFTAGETSDINLHYSNEIEPTEPQFTVLLPDGTEQILNANKMSEKGTGFTTSYTPSAPGNHHLTVKRETPAGPVYLKHVIHVPQTTKELATTKAKPETLTDLARITGGSILSGDSNHNLLNSLDTLETNVIHFRDRSLWDRWWVLLILIALLSTGWYLRRKWGFA